MENFNHFFSSVFSYFGDLFGNAFNYITSLGLSDVLDIAIVAFLIYKLIGLLRKASFSRLGKGVVFLVLALWISGWVHLTVINFLLRRAVELGLLALVILFQPELRRVLEKVGSGKITNLLGREPQFLSTETAITQTVMACVQMGKEKVGALIVFERDNQLTQQMNTGTVIDADTSSELLRNIFYPKAPLHDGAVIIKDGRIAAGGCMLPLTNNTNLSHDLGMRHRAGLGMSEHSDAVVVIVSEETGSISVAVDGMLKRHLSSETCEKLLRNELISDDAPKTGSRLTNLFKVKNDDKKENQ